MQGADGDEGEVSITSMDDSLLDGDPFVDPEDMAPEDEVDDGGYELVETDVVDEYLTGFADPDQEPAEDPVGYALPSALPTGGSMPGAGLGAAVIAALVALVVLVAGAISGGG